MLTYADVCRAVPETLSFRYSYDERFGDCIKSHGSIEIHDDKRDTPPSGTQFTWFTGTKLQILTLRTHIYDTSVASAPRTGTLFSGIVKQAYLYKSTNTDAKLLPNRPEVRALLA